MYVLHMCVVYIPDEASQSNFLLTPQYSCHAAVGEQLNWDNGILGVGALNKKI